MGRLPAGRPRSAAWCSRAAGRGQDGAAQRAAGAGGQAGLGTGKIEGPARPNIHLPVARRCTRGHAGLAPPPRPDRVGRGGRRPEELRPRTGLADRKGMHWTPLIDVPRPAAAPTRGPRARPGQAVLVLSRRWPATSTWGRPVRRRDAGHRAPRAPCCGACHGSASGALRWSSSAPTCHHRSPWLPSKSYAGACSATFPWTGSGMADRAWRRPAARGTVEFETGRPRRGSTAHRQLPYFVRPTRKVTWDVALRVAGHRRGRHEAAPGRGRARGRVLRRPLRPGHPAEQDYMTAMADLGAEHGDAASTRPTSPATLRPQAAVPVADPRRADQKGLVCSGGGVAVTVHTSGSSSARA